VRTETCKKKNADLLFHASNIQFFRLLCYDFDDGVYYLLERHAAAVQLNSTLDLMTVR
jgi:hypothetical protein